MRVREVQVSCRKTVNLGDYNSLTIGAGVTVDLDPGDDVNAARAVAQVELKRLLRETYGAQHKVPTEEV